MVNGQGDLTMVTTDLLGRQTTVTVPYYASTSLLKPGLHDYSIAAGFIRLNYGQQSNDYGEFMAVGMDRFGITPKFTGEVRLEALRDQQTLGFGGQYLLLDWATLTGAVAGSTSDFGQGGLAEFGFSRASQDWVNVGFNLTATSPNFTQIGFGEDQVAPSFQGQYFAGTQVFDMGTLAASYVQQNNRGSENQGFVTLTYSQPLFKVWAMSITGFSQVQGPTNNSIYLSFSRMFDTYTSMNLSGGSQTGGNNQAQAQLNRSLPLGPGWGYNLYAQTGEGGETYQGSLVAQNDVGTYSVGAANSGDKTAYNAGVQGSLAVIDNEIYLARLLGDSFGVVEVPGLAGVEVYNYNQVVATTGKDGKAFMPILLPYQNNKVAIEPNDLPIGTEIQVAEMNVVPYNQSGLLIRFPITSYYSALVHLVDSEGKDLPPGTRVTMLEVEGEMMVAEKGVAYLNRLKLGENRFKGRYNGKECFFTIIYVLDPVDPIPDLGTILCDVCVDEPVEDLTEQDEDDHAEPIVGANTSVHVEQAETEVGANAQPGDMGPPAYIPPPDNTIKD
jgi:outer membrane usher protein